MDDFDTTGKDYVLQVKIRNGPLLRAVRATGLTYRELARKAGIPVSSLYRYLSLKSPALLWNGHFAPAVVKLAEILNKRPAELFPARHLLEPLEKNSAEIEASQEDLLSLAEVLRNEEVPLLERSQTHSMLYQMISELDHRKAEVLRMRYGLEPYEREHKLDEIAERFGIQRERVRQIEMEGLRRLRSPKQRNRLIQTGGYDFLVAQHIPPPDDYYERHGKQVQLTYILDYFPDIPKPGNMVCTDWEEKVVEPYIEEKGYLMGSWRVIGDSNNHLLMIRAIELLNTDIKLYYRVSKDRWEWRPEDESA